MENLKEIYDKENIKKLNVDGYWYPKLGESPDNEYMFYYNVKGDSEKCYDDKGSQSPCYYVRIENGYISFGHLETGMSDRWKYLLKKTNNNESEATKLSQEQMNTILWAIGEYVEKIHPWTINWTAIQKSNVNSKNPDSRSKVYFLWAGRNLYPEYVPESKIQWIKLESFLNSPFAKNEGVPTKEEIKNMSAKNFFKICEDIKKELEEKRKAEEKEREIAREQRRMAELQPYLENPEINPNDIKLDDVVFLNDEKNKFNHGKLFIVKRIQSYDGTIEVVLNPKNEENDLLPHDSYARNQITNIENVHKINEKTSSIRSSIIQRVTQEENIARLSRERKIELFLSSPEINPNGIQIGDSVFIKDPNFGTRHGHRGKIINFTISVGGLEAEVEPVHDADLHSNFVGNRVYNIKYLYKATPENTRIRNYNLPVRARGVIMPPPEY